MSDLKKTEHLLRELRKASYYCTGPKSFAAHEERIRQVEAEVRELKNGAKNSETS